MFEIGALILGFLYIGHLYFQDVIDLIETTNEIEKEDELKAKDDELIKISKTLYKKKKKNVSPPFGASRRLMKKNNEK